MKQEFKYVLVFYLILIALFIGAFILAKLSWDIYFFHNASRQIPDSLLEFIPRSYKHFAGVYRADHTDYDLFIAKYKYDTTLLNFSDLRRIEDYTCVYYLILGGVPIEYLHFPADTCKKFILMPNIEYQYRNFDEDIKVIADYIYKYEIGNFFNYQGEKHGFKVYGFPHGYTQGASVVEVDGEKYIYFWVMLW